MPIKFYPFIPSHGITAWLLMLLNRFFIKEDVCFSSETCGEILMITSCRLCRLLCWIGIIESSEGTGHKLYSLEIKNASYAASLCTQTLYIYDFSLSVHENGSFSSASLFVLSADYKPKKIKTEDIKKAKKRKQEEEEVM